MKWLVLLKAKIKLWWLQPLLKGVNVPNATIMVIGTERFGLSQLYQLRGRVGRGGDQSYCILMSKDKLSDEARTRTSVVSTTDGFKLSEIDLELRGPGDRGTQQSGLSNLQLADLRAIVPF